MTFVANRGWHSPPPGPWPECEAGRLEAIKQSKLECMKLGCSYNVESFCMCEDKQIYLDSEGKCITEEKRGLWKGPEADTCAACSGSGWYDKTDKKGRSIKCGACGGTGRIK